ncbi:uncharacterized protein N0V89_006746 [Didymosphaeria variabile]|uniref:Zn(2)-C6 fungal-type domain-containing protein n=1 Tax=Didymosphaeria variabile TaxID=1932322 RepID=A0A9W8XI62_9PLEO|nr:uncharacterized protein N0V89_006746 [Didymosphaeria variabile]KAJ4351404.1 hypothetical protein N0V89_006746 [Didymosphaeria variabile]
MTPTSSIADQPAIEARIAQLEQSQFELTKTTMDLTMKVMDKNNKIMQLSGKLRNKDLNLRRSQKKIAAVQKQTKKVERSQKRDIKRLQKATSALKEQLELIKAEAAKPESVHDSIAPCSPSAADTEPPAPRIVTCVQCFERRRKCDKGEPCRPCADRRLVCERMKCDHFEPGACVRLNCGRLHQDEMEKMGYKRVVPSRRIPKPKQVYHPQE